MLLSTLALLATLVAQTREKEWAPPYENLPITLDSKEIEQHLAGKPSAVWQEGEVLNIVYRAKEDPVQVVPGIDEPMKRIPGTDLVALQLKMANWDEALLGLLFLGKDARSVNMRDMLVFRGSKAPEPPVRAETLQGTVKEYTLKSAALGEDRKVSVYLPPNAPKTGLPAFYLADGEGCDGFASVLEPLILAHKVRPAAIIGPHSGGYRGSYEHYDQKLNFRSKEYIPGQDPEWYAKHMTFFTSEVVDWAGKEFGLSARPEDRCVVGASNGGDFAVEAGLQHPEVFKQSIGLSMAGERKKLDYPNTGDFFLATGTLERPNKTTHQFVDAGSKAGLKIKLDEYVSGHDTLMWWLAFTRFAQQIFPA